MQKDKASYETIKEKFLARYGNTTTAAQSRFEIQNEIMALRQNLGEDIASYVRKAEKLSKRVPAELDSMMALCLIKGMTNELKKADISYIVQSQPKTSFRDAIEIIKAKYRIIGEPDPFGQLGGRKPEKSTNWGAAYTPPANEPSVIPVAAAARMGQIPTYNVGRRMGEGQASGAGQSKEIYGESGGLAAALEACGISHHQLKGLVDWYLKDTGSETLDQRARNDGERQRLLGGQISQDFHQPALLTPGVINPAHGDGRNVGLPSLKTSGYANAAPPGISCFSCGRRGHYSTTCPYPPLPIQDQERLREQARVNCLQRAGLMPGVAPMTNAQMAGGVYAMQILQNHEQRIEDITQMEEIRSPAKDSEEVANITNLGTGTAGGEIVADMNTGDNTRAGRIGAACAILSRLPLVMAVIQDVMAGKRMRTLADDGTEEITGAPAAKTPRVRQTVAESIDGGYEGNGEELNERVHVRPGGARESGAGEQVRANMRRQASGSERRLPMGGDIDMENDDSVPPSPAGSLTPEPADVQGSGLGKENETQVPEWIQ